MTINIDQLSESELIHLNERIVQRLRMMNQMRAHMRMLDFTLGESVSGSRRRARKSSAECW
jgi:hypothetical protein